MKSFVFKLMLFNKILHRFFTYQGIYQVAKWNGTKVSVKILDKDLYKDHETMYVYSSLI